MSRVGAYGNVLGKWMTQVRASQANTKIATEQLSTGEAYRSYPTLPPRYKPFCKLQNTLHHTLIICCSPLSLRPTSIFYLQSDT
jgi:hypothetical protein